MEERFQFYAKQGYFDKLKIDQNKDDYICIAFLQGKKILKLTVKNGEVLKVKYMKDEIARIDRFDGVLLEKMKQKVMADNTLTGSQLKFKKGKWEYELNGYLDYLSTDQLKSVSVLVGPDPGTTTGIVDCITAFMKEFPKEKGKRVFSVINDGDRNVDELVDEEDD